MSDKKLRTNHLIKAQRVRLINQKGEQVGVVSITEALRMANQAKLDLVEVSPNAVPPVCKLLDYGRFVFEKTKKQPETPRKAKQQVKEVKFRPVIGQGDYDVKMRMIVRFLEANDKVKVVVRFRGREMMHQHLGITLLDRIKLEIVAIATVLQEPKMEGRQLMMVFGPLKR